MFNYWGSINERAKKNWGKLERHVKTQIAEREQSNRGVFHVTLSVSARQAESFEVFQTVIGLYIYSTGA